MGKVFLLSLGTVEDARVRFRLGVEEVIETTERLQHEALVEAILDKVRSRGLVGTRIEFDPDLLPTPGDALTFVVISRATDLVPTPKEAALHHLTYPRIVDALQQLGDAPTQGATIEIFDAHPLSEDATFQFIVDAIHQEEPGIFDPVINTYSGDDTYGVVRGGTENPGESDPYVDVVGYETVEDATTTADIQGNEFRAGYPVDPVQAIVTLLIQQASIRSRDDPATESDAAHHLQHAHQPLSTPTHQETQVVDYFGNAVSFGQRAGVVERPNGTFDLLKVAGGAKKRLVLGEFTGTYPSGNIEKAIYYLYYGSASTLDTDEKIHFKWELPPPNYVKNWHFVKDLSEWTIADPNSNVTIAQSGGGGPPYTHGIVQIYSPGGINSDKNGSNEMRQLVGGLPTDADRTVKLSLRHDYVNGTGTLKAQLKEYDSATPNTPGALITEFTLPTTDTDWTLNEWDVTTSMGTRDKVWVVIYAEDLDLANRIYRAIDDVRLEVTTPRTRVVAPTTVKTYTATTGPPRGIHHFNAIENVDYGGWKMVAKGASWVEGESTSVTVDGDNSIYFSSSNPSSTGEDIHYALNFSQGMVEGSWEFWYRSSVSSAVAEATQQARIGFNTDIDGGGTSTWIDLPQVDAWRRITVSYNGGTLHVRHFDSNGVEDLAAEKYTVGSTLKSISLFGTAAYDQYYNIWWDAFTLHQPLVIDLSAANIAPEDFGRLLLHIEHDKINSTRAESYGVFVDGVGLRWHRP